MLERDAVFNEDALKFCLKLLADVVNDENSSAFRRRFFGFVKKNFYD